MVLAVAGSSPVIHPCKTEMRRDDDQMPNLVVITNLFVASFEGAGSMDKAPDFKVGDVVQLKCGGPVLIVQSIESDEVSCIYLDELGSQKSFSFKPAMLIVTENRNPKRP